MSIHLCVHLCAPTWLLTGGYSHGRDQTATQPVADGSACHCWLSTWDACKSLQVSWALLRKGAVFLPSVANSCLHLRLQLPSWKDVFASQKAVMLEHKNGLDLKGLCFFKEEVFATNKIVPPLFHYPLSNIVPFHPFVVNAYI